MMTGKDGCVELSGIEMLLVLSETSSPLMAIKEAGKDVYEAGVVGSTGFSNLLASIGIHIRDRVLTYPMQSTD